MRKLKFQPNWMETHPVVHRLFHMDHFQKKKFLAKNPIVFQFDAV